MRAEFLDFIDDILDAMDKAELLLTDVTYDQFANDLWNTVKQVIPRIRPFLQRILVDYSEKP